MAIEGLEYETNEWDGLGKEKGRTTLPPRPQTTRTQTVIVNAPKPVVSTPVAQTAVVRADPVMTTINGFIAQVKKLLGIK